jgi:Tol biopolymer transport system component
MLTGRRAFWGATVTEVLASVLTCEPAWKALPDDTPDSIRRLLRRCLHKDPKQRLHDIADARLELDDAAAAPPRRIEARRPPRWAVGVGAVLLAFLAIVLARKLTVPEPARAIVRAQRLTDLVGLEETPALAPDGRSLVFTAGVKGKRQVFVQLLEGGGHLQITRDDADHQFPRWTPASSSVVYFSSATPSDIQGTLWEIPALGGPPRRVVDSLGAGDVRASDSRLAFFRQGGGAIQLVTALLDGSSVKLVAQFEPNVYYRFPRWSPDGKWIADQVGQSLNWEIFIAPADGGKPLQLTHEGREINGLAWLPDSTGILYSSTRGDSMLYLPTARLWQVALDDGTVRQVTSGETSYVHPDIAKDGAVVVGRVHLASDIWKFPTDGTPQLNVQHAVRITNQTGQVVTPTAGPGDREVAFVSDRGGHANLWVINVESGDLRQITHERDPSVTVGVPVWSPGSESIAFVSSRGGSVAAPLGIWLVNRDGSNLRSLVTPAVGPTWSPDGSAVYYTGQMPAGVSKITAAGGRPTTVRKDRVRNSIGTDGRTLYLVMERSLVDGMPEFEIRAANPENGPTRVLARIPPARVPTWQIFNPTLSPDGKWIAQALTDGFSTNIWTLSTSTGTWRQITDFLGRPTFIARRVSWSSDGRSVLAAVAEGDADIVLLDGLLGPKRQ